MTSLAADDLGFIGCVHCRGLRDGRPGSATGTRPRATDEENATNFSLSPAEICNNNNHNNDNQLKTAPTTRFHQLENLIFFFSYRFRLLVDIPTLLRLHIRNIPSLKLRPKRQGRPLNGESNWTMSRTATERGRRHKFKNR